MIPFHWSILFHLYELRIHIPFHYFLPIFSLTISCFTISLYSTFSLHLLHSTPSLHFPTLSFSPLYPPCFYFILFSLSYSISSSASSPLFTLHFLWTFSLQRFSLHLTFLLFLSPLSHFCSLPTFSFYFLSLHFHSTFLFNIIFPHSHSISSSTFPLSTLS